MQNFIKLVLFAFFFSIGAATLACSVLARDLMRYYHYKQLRHSARESLRQLESLNAEYDVLWENLQRDPNLLQRVAPVIVGGTAADQ